jgi:toxin-antitoxin system PIN domain toxin
MTTELALLDVNVLLALAWRQHVHHRPAQTWFGLVEGRRFATCALTETAFLRLSTNANVVGGVVLLPEVTDLLRHVRRLPGHQYLADDTSLAEPVIDLARASAGNQVTDLHLVNLAASHRAVLATFDRSITSYLEPQDQRHLLQLS